MVSLPRGIRNNNPANIRKSFTKWQGLVSPEKCKDSSFCEFISLEFGIRAFLILCRTYRQKYGIKSVTDFIHRFAPSSENDTDKYVSYVLKNMNRDNLLYDYHYDYLSFYIFSFENGGSFVSLSQIMYCHCKYDIKIVSK